MKKNKSSFLALLMTNDDIVQPCDKNIIKQWTPSDGTLWIHLCPEHLSLFRLLRKQRYISSSIFSQLTSEDVRTKVSNNAEDFLCILRTLNIEEKDDIEEMISIRFYAKENLIITYMMHSPERILPIYQDFLNQRKTLHAQQVFQSICEKIIQEIAEHTDVISEQIEQIEETIFDKYSTVMQQDISTLQKRLLTLRRYLIPIKNTLYNCLNESSQFLSIETKQNLQASADRLARIIDNIELYKEKCYLFIQVSSNQLSNELNSRMYFFSLIATIFLPISAISSIFGMNVGGLSWLSDTHGFIYALIIIALFSGALLSTLKLRRWL